MKELWPNTTAPDKTNPYWKFNNNLTINGTPYKKSEISPGKWQWVVNEELLRLSQIRENHRRDLFWALRSRVLTDAEMTEVDGYRDSLNIEQMVSFNPAEKARELNDALLQQFKLRLAAERSASMASAVGASHAYQAIQAHARRPHRRAGEGESVSDYGDFCRDLRDAKRDARSKHGVPCPECQRLLPKAHPAILLPGQKCRIHGYRDPRKRTADTEYLSHGR